MSCFGPLPENFTITIAWEHEYCKWYSGPLYNLDRLNYYHPILTKVAIVIGVFALIWLFHEYIIKTRMK